MAGDRNHAERRGQGIPKSEAQDLLVSCSNGNEAMTRRILGKSGSRASLVAAVRDDHGFGPLHFATACGNLALVRLLCGPPLSQDPHEAAGGSQYATPTVIAARCGYAGILEYLADTHRAMEVKGVPATMQEWETALTAGGEPAAKNGRAKLVPAIGGPVLPVDLEDLPRASRNGQSTVRLWLARRFPAGASTAITNGSDDEKVDVPAERGSQRERSTLAESPRGSRSVDPNFDGLIDEGDDPDASLRARRGMIPLKIKTDDLGGKRPGSQGQNTNAATAQPQQQQQQRRHPQQPPLDRRGNNASQEQRHTRPLDDSSNRSTRKGPWKALCCLGSKR